MSPFAPIVVFLCLDHPPAELGAAIAEVEANSPDSEVFVVGSDPHLRPGPKFVHVESSDYATALAAGLEAVRRVIDFNPQAARVRDGVVFVTAEALTSRDWLWRLVVQHPDAIVVDGVPVPIQAPTKFPVGLAVPVCEQSTAIPQRCTLSQTDVAAGLDGYADRRFAQFGRTVSPIGSPDPLAGWIALDVFPSADEIPRIRSLADVARSVRACGYLAVVAEGSYVGRRVPREARPAEVPDPDAADRRLAEYNRGPVFGLARNAAGRAVIATVIASITRARDVYLLRMTIARAAQLCDGVAVLLVNHPLDAQGDPEFIALSRQPPSPALTEADRAMLQGCNGQDASGVEAVFGRWVDALCGGRRGLAKVWTGLPDHAAKQETVTTLAHSFARGRDLWCLALEPGEIVEPGVNAAFLARLIAHPSSAVAAYDVASLTVWDSPRLVREDPPYGDGGTFRGGPSAPRLFRMRGALFVPGGPYRLGPVVAEDAIRVAAIRLHDLRVAREADRTGLRLRVFEEGMNTRAITNARLGLHMLTYRRESPEDVGRWLDELHGLCDVQGAVVVWTDTEPPPEVLRDLVFAHGAALVEHPLTDDLAAARNAGIDYLRVLPAGSSALFVDPDEWLSDPVADARAIRRMVESRRAGWLFRVANQQGNGNVSISESVRIAALIPEMRMTGRVHEGFAEATAAMYARGDHPRLGYAPFTLQHRGQALGVARTREKLDAYARLLRLELAERPNNCGAWISLAWHHENDGRHGEAAECFARALACAGESYLPFREVGIRKLREARALMSAALDKLVPGSPYYEHTRAAVEWLSRFAPEPAQGVRSSETSPEPEPPVSDVGPLSTDASYDPETGRPLA